jgi:FKBP-type peptidyl-prolyl cis-trans isomerase FkpA
MFKPLYTLFCLSFVFALLFTACDKQYPGIEELDTQTVQDYLQKNNLNFQEYGNSDIYYQVIKQGSGPAMDYTKQLPLLYTVKTLDGSYTSIDTFNNRYASYFGYFKPDSLREVMMNSGLKQGGKIRVILPSRFAFGKSGSGSIPGNSSLDYTISVINPDDLDLYEDAVIQAYLLANNLTGFIKSNTGLYYKIADAGTGVDAITDQSVLTVEYTGKLFNGTVFDKTATGSTATFPLSNLVQGWREGLPLIKKGGSIRLLIPSHLGYGLGGSNAIPPFACLDFDIKVTEVVN